MTDWQATPPTESTATGGMAAEPVAPDEPEQDEHVKLVALGELMERKDRLSDLLQAIDVARDAARIEAGLPDTTDDDDTEEQEVLRVGLLEVDEALTAAGVLPGGAPLDG